MSFSNNLPTIDPSLNLDFANTKVLDPRITFTRASTATFYDGVTEALAEQNLLLQSQTFTTGWSTTNVTISDNTTAAPDSTTTAATLTDNTTNGVHNIFKNIGSHLANTTYTLSCFAKAGTNNYVVLSMQSGDSLRRATAVFDLSNGTVGQTLAGSSTTLVGSGITAVGSSGWYRIYITYSFATAVAASYLNIEQAPAATGNTIDATYGDVSYAGTGKTIFLWGIQLEQRSAVTAYTPTTTQPITNYIPVLKTATTNTPRFSHNPITGESLGLLIEEQRTNLATQSQTFSGWAITGETIQNNTVISPDGTLSASALIPTTENSTHNAALYYTVGSGTFTFSIYAKAAGYPRLGIRVYDGSAYQLRATFDLSTGSIVTTEAGTASITSAGNGWYRCVCTGTSASGNLGTVAGWAVESLPSDNVVQQAFIGNGYSGAYIWGAQIEAGTFATSYIPTTSAQVTRSAENASITGINFTNFYSGNEGTLFVHAISNGNISTGGFSPTAVSVNDDTISNAIAISRYTGTNNLLAATNANSVTQFGLTSSNVFSSSPSEIKTGFSYKSGAFASCANGGTLQTASSGIIPTSFTQINIGSYPTGARWWDGSIKRITYYPFAITNAQLQGLTI